MVHTAQKASAQKILEMTLVHSRGPPERKEIRSKPLGYYCDSPADGILRCRWSKIAAHRIAHNSSPRLVLVRLTKTKLLSNG
jgi:hypothetical protein